MIDPEGRLWRARSYEDFETTYRIEGNTCEIETLRPLYAQIREYLPESDIDKKEPASNSARAR